MQIVRERPWQGRVRPADVLCLAGIVFARVYLAALWLLWPMYIGTHPVVLEALNPSTASVVAAAAFARVGRAPLLMVIAAALPAAMKFDLLYWWAGRLWGRHIVAWFSRRFRRFRHPRRSDHDRDLADRRCTGLAVVIASCQLLPGEVVYAMAGWIGMRMTTFLALDLVGTLLWIALLAGFGYALGQPAVDVAQTVSRYGLWISLGLATLAGAIVVVRQLRHRDIGRGRP